MKVLVLKCEMNVHPEVMDKIKEQFGEEVKESLQYGYVVIPPGCSYEIVDMDVLIYDNHMKYTFNDEEELKAYPFYPHEEKADD